MTCWSMCPSRVKQQSGDCREITGPSSGVKPHQKHLLFKKANKNAEPGTGQPALYRWKKTWQVEGSEATMNVWPFPDKRYLPSFLPLSALCLIATTWLSIYQTPAKIYSFFFPYRHHHLVLIVFKLLLCVLYLCPSLPLRTSEDECGNRDREVLGQSLGAAGRMHRAVVGGAASVGKGRPGPISTQREEDKEGRFGHKQRDTSQSECSQRGKKRDAHKNQTPQHCNRVKKETKRKRRFYSPSSPWQETHA